MSGDVVGKAVWILEDATTNHKPVERRIFFVELQGGGAVCNIAVDEELGFWGVILIILFIAFYAFVGYSAARNVRRHNGFLSNLAIGITKIS